MTWSKRAGEGVDAWDDLVAAGDGEGAAGEEVVLHVDHEEGVGGEQGEAHGLKFTRGGLALTAPGCKMSGSIPSG